MDSAEKRRLKARWREQQRETARAALPLPVAELKALFDMLDVEVLRQGCDHTHRITEAWLMSRGHIVQRVLTWLDTQGGYCDCEILANVEEAVEEAMKSTNSKLN